MGYTSGRGRDCLVVGEVDEGDEVVEEDSAVEGKVEEKDLRWEGQDGNEEDHATHGEVRE